MPNLQKKSGGPNLWGEPWETGEGISLAP